MQQSRRSASSTPTVSSRLRYQSGRAASLLVIACVLLATAKSVGADEERSEGVLPANVYLGGSSVRPTAPVKGDLFGAGGSVTVDQPVGRDVVVAGGDVQVKGPVGEDLRAAGGQVAVGGRVGGEALLAGGTVSLGPGSDVAGRAVLMGGHVIVAGHIGGGGRIYASKVSISGDVEGDLKVLAEEIELLPGANIRGALNYASRKDIRIDPAARVAGTVTREEGPEQWRTQPRDRGTGVGVWPFWLLGLIAAGALFVLVFPRFSEMAESRVGDAPWASLGLGAAIAFAAPVVVVLLLVTIVGIPLALAFMAAYAIALLAGYLTVAGYLGRRLASILRKGMEMTPGWRIGALAAALLVLGLVGMIPFVGALILLIALTLGTGAFVLQLFRRYSTAS